MTRSPTTVYSPKPARVGGQAVFESLFVRTVQQCVAAGLVDGTKLHVDGSLVDAHASRDAVVRAGPELISALKRAYRVEEQKLEGASGAPRPINATLCSTTDPDAPCIRNSKVGASGDTRPRYKQHRAVDDRCGVITATITTGGHVAEPTQTVPLIEQHDRNTGGRVTTVVGDQQYGTIDNHRTLQRRGVRTHLKTLPGPKRDNGRFVSADFSYDQTADRYQCPAGQWLYPRRFDPQRQHTQYTTRKGVCAGCPLKSQCTTSKHGRELNRYLEHDLVMTARAQARSSAARQDYRRRRHLMEGSFAQSANAHGAKRSRWRRLWRQQIQDWLIAACVNLKLLLRALRPEPTTAAAERNPCLALPRTLLTPLGFDALPG